MPDRLPADIRPIELVTENGFSILRRWEIDGVPPPSDGKCHFLVRNPQNMQREVIVEFTDDVVVWIEIHTSRRIRLRSTFWFCCAERRLAIYLWENDDYPVSDKLCIEQLDPEDVILAVRWQTS